MRKLVAIEHLTLDGVYQGPARPDEDRRNGFAYGGWAASDDDAEMQQVIGARMGRAWSLLVGRTTYEDLYGYWPKQPANPMTEALNHVEKFVVSTSLSDPLPWQNSVLLKGNGAEAVAKLKRNHEKTLVIFGSGVLVQSLMPHEVIDEYVLQIHPVVLGQGRRLFPDGGTLAKLGLVNTVATKTGVVILTYQPVSER